MDKSSRVIENDTLLLTDEEGRNNFIQSKGLNPFIFNQTGSDSIPETANYPGNVIEGLSFSKIPLELDINVSTVQDTDNIPIWLKPRLPKWKVRKKIWKKIWKMY